MKKTIEIRTHVEKFKWRTKIDLIGFAVICIAVGLIIIGKNTGIISEELYKILISWQMLLVVLGLHIVTHRTYLFGTFVMGIGAFFLTPLITGSNENWFSDFWPLIFVFIGLLIIFKILLPKKRKNCMKFDDKPNSFHTENGFVVVDNSFSQTKHVVMDEVFKGAKIKNNFGGVELDLRRTTLESGNTYIDIDCSFGGIEMRVPNNWLVLTELDSVMSGVSDERPSSGNENLNYKLILRGKISLSGIEIK